ncbi:tRNA N(3)-methylcytidine methyltransferase METTL6-like, partial [Armigeres subalbatus]|uniref:tRNA N(3)-methylcytidine methyltransferase METTL6-like n=1 Tax=Armigeres subalbatus TaxID=124917 RepID=UPI002ED66489
MLCNDDDSSAQAVKQGAFDLGDVATKTPKTLTDDEKLRLQEQNKRMISDFQARKLELEARKHWDLFYKRNETRFFKDRHWTTREFEELLVGSSPGNDGTGNSVKTMLEIGCGVGNLVFPLIEDGHRDYFIYACDL